MSRKNHRRDYNGRQGSAQRPWQQEQADGQNRGSMQRNQYDNIGRDRYGSNSGQGGGYGSRDWDQGSDEGTRPNWPGENRGFRGGAGSYGPGRFDQGEGSDQGEEYGDQRYGRGTESRRYRSQGYGGDQGMSRYQLGEVGQNYGDADDGYDRGRGSQRGSGNWGEGDAEYGGRSGAQRNFEEGRWHRSQGSRRDQPWGNQAGYGTQQYGSQQYGSGQEGSRSYGSSQSGSGRTGSQYGQGPFSQDSSRSQGEHSGRGPKGYRRSDERIQEDVNEELTHHPEIDASEIEVKVSNGEVTLTGTVDNREAKRMAEDAAEGISGVADVHNQIRVQKTVGASRTGEDEESGSSRSKSGKSGSSSSSTTTGTESSRNRTGTGVGA